MGTGPHKGWGGKRPGSFGRKDEPVAPANSMVKAFLKKATERAKKEKKQLAEVLLDMIYGKEEPNTKLKALKLYLEVIVPRRTESEVTVKKTTKKAVNLPEMKTDPAKVIQMKGAH